MRKSTIRIGRSSILKSISYKRRNERSQRGRAFTRLKGCAAAGRCGTPRCISAHLGRRNSRRSLSKKSHVLDVAVTSSCCSSSPSSSSSSSVFASTSASAAFSFNLTSAPHSRRRVLLPRGITTEPPISRACTVDFYYVLRHVNELIYQSLPVDLRQNATLIVIS